MSETLDTPFVCVSVCVSVCEPLKHRAVAMSETVDA